MINKDETISYANTITTLAKESFTEVVKSIYKKEDIPNVYQVDENSLHIGLVLEPNNLHMNIMVSYAENHNYLAEVSTAFMSDDIHYPLDNPKFIIKGTPKLGLHVTQIPIGSDSLYGALDLTLDYLLENIENIVIEALGMENLM